MSMDKQMRILVVDDSSAIRRVIVSALHDLGLRNTIEAADGKHALEVLDKDQIDLILSDSAMPNMSGLELLEQVRSSKQLRSKPFIMLTGQKEKEYMIEAVRKGANSYLVKPFKPQALGEKISKVVRKPLSV
ncbi:MAG: response regulator [Desulfovibrionaceae bacterium]